MITHILEDQLVYRAFDFFLPDRLACNNESVSYLDDQLVYRAFDCFLPDRPAFILKARNGFVEEPIDTS